MKLHKYFIWLAAALLCGPALANTCTIRQAGATDQTVYVEFIDATTGVPNSSLAYNTSGIDLEYVRVGATAVDITEATQTTNGAHSDGGFVSVGHGRYRLDLPDAAVAAGVPEVVIQGVVTGYIMLPCAVSLSPPVNSVALGGTAQTGRDIGASVLLSNGTGTGQISLSSGTVTTGAISANAITATAIATDAITAAKIAADAIGSSELATGAITTAEFAAGAIDAAAIAADAIGASEIATAAITAAEMDLTGSEFTAIPWNSAWDAEVESEVDDSIGGGTGTALTAIPWNASWDAEVQSEAADAINADTGDSFTAIPWNAAWDTEVESEANDALVAIHLDHLLAATYDPASKPGAADALLNELVESDGGVARFTSNALEQAPTGGGTSDYDLGIVASGTAQSATSTTIRLDSAETFADDELIGATVLVTGGSAGVGQSRTITDYVSSTDTATVDTWTTTPSGTITYNVFGTASGSGGSGATAADVWSYGTRTLTALDEDSTSIDLNASYVGGVTVFDEDLTTIDINATATGAAASVTGAVGSVTGAVGSVTGNVGGNVTGSVGSVATGGITASSIATDAIGAAELASDAGTELGTANWATTTRVLTAGTNIALAKGTGVTGFNDPTTAAIADAVWDEAQSGHVTAGTFGAYLDSSVSGVSTGGVSAADIADAVWDEALAGHTTSGTSGERMGRIPNAAAGGNGGLPTVNASNYIAGLQGTLNTLDALDTAQDTQHSTTQGRLPAALVGGRMDATVDGTGMEAGAVSALAAGLNDLDATEVQTAAAAALTAYDPPTRTEATSDANSILAAIAALNDVSVDDVGSIVIEDQGSTISLKCAMAVVVAYAAGDLVTSGSNSTYEDPSGSETRITGTVGSAGNRTASVTCPTY